MKKVEKVVIILDLIFPTLILLYHLASAQEEPPGPTIIAITSPTSGASVSGIVTLSAVVYVPAGISSTRWTIVIGGGKILDPTSISTSWITPGFVEGGITIIGFYVTDSLNRTAVTSVTVTVNNPVPSITSPVDGSVVGGIVPLTATNISSPAGIESITWDIPTAYTIGGYYGQIVDPSSAQTEWKTPAFAQNLFAQVRLTVRDKEGYGFQKWVTVRVTNPQPEITSPVDGSEVGGIIPLTATNIYSPFGIESITWDIPTPYRAGQIVDPSSAQTEWKTPAFAQDLRVQIRLTVVDNEGRKAQKSAFVRVTNPLPTITSPADGASIYGDVLLTVDAYSPSGIKSYLWQFFPFIGTIDDPTSPATVWHIPADHEGRIQVRVWVTDNLNVKAYTYNYVDVILPPPELPVPPDPETLVGPRDPRFLEYIKALDTFLRNFAEWTGRDEIIEALDAAKAQDPDGLDFNSELPENEIDPSMSDPGPDGQYGTDDDGLVYYRTVFGQYWPYRNSLEMGPAALRSNLTAARNYLHECFHALNDYLIEKGLDIDPDGDFLVNRYDPTPTVRDEEEKERITDNFARENNPFFED